MERFVLVFGEGETEVVALVRAVSVGERGRNGDKLRVLRVELLVFSVDPSTITT